MDRATRSVNQLKFNPPPHHTDTNNPSPPQKRRVPETPHSACAPSPQTGHSPAASPARGNAGRGFSPPRPHRPRRPRRRRWRAALSGRCCTGRGRSLGGCPPAAPRRRGGRRSRGVKGEGWWWRRRPPRGGGGGGTRGARAGGGRRRGGTTFFLLGGGVLSVGVELPSAPSKSISPHFFLIKKTHATNQTNPKQPTRKQLQNARTRARRPQSPCPGPCLSWAAPPAWP